MDGNEATGKLLALTLPVELSNRNDGQGHSWHRTASERKKIHRQLEAFFAGQDAFNGAYGIPVRLRLTRILGPKQRLWDADSVLRGNAKQLLDSLVKLGLFIDDGPKHIVDVHGLQDANQRDNGPAVFLEVFAVS